MQADLKRDGGPDGARLKEPMPPRGGPPPMDGGNGCGGGPRAPKEFVRPDGLQMGIGLPPCSSTCGPVLLHLVAPVLHRLVYSQRPSSAELPLLEVDSSWNRRPILRCWRWWSTHTHVSKCLCRRPIVKRRRPPTGGPRLGPPDGGGPRPVAPNGAGFDDAGGGPRPKSLERGGVAKVPAVVDHCFAGGRAAP